MSKAKVFLFSCIFFIFGIAVASFTPIKFLQYDLWFFGVIVGLVVIIILYKIIRRDAPLGRLLYFIFLLFFILGIWRYSIGLPNNTPDKIWFYNNQAIEFIGIVNKEPDVRMFNTKLTVVVKNLTNGLPVRGNVLITTRLYPEYNYGDRLQIKCELQQPEPFGEFAYDQYLARHDIYSICYYPSLTPNPSPSSGEGSWIYSQILEFKDKLKEVINYGLLEPEASVLQAMLLGNRRGLPPELLNNFSQAGVSHIIAISGMHIALLSVIVMQILFMVGLSRRWAFGLTTTFLIIYVIIIGLPASAVRASIMTFLILLAMQLGRLGNVTNGLVFTASLLLFFNPRLLRDDIGFQLSFLAVLSIVYIFPIIDKYFDKIKIPPPHWAGQAKLKGIRDIITVTLAAQVLTLPIIALNFHQVSLVAPLVNLLIVPLLPVIMGGGLLALILSLLIPGLAWLFFSPVYLILKYLLWITEASIHLPLAYIEVDYIWVGWIILFYAIAGYFIWYNVNNKRQIINSK